MTDQREAAVTALLAQVTGAYAWTSAPSRRLKLWSDVPRDARPAAFLFEGGTETHTYSNGAIAKRTIEAKLFVYTDCSDQTSVGATQLNEIAGALDAVIGTQSGADIGLGRNTLGGTAYWCRIEGNTLKVPGDLDGDGVLVVPIKITLP